MVEKHQVSFSSHTLIAQPRRLVLHHLIMSFCLPRFRFSWLRRFQERYNIKWKRAGGSGSVDLLADAAEVQRPRSVIDSYYYANVLN